ncbi:MAG: DNA alkylation repair protein [Alistipes onderdonkii]
MRRERNGAVADSMRYYGTPYGLNYGVSLPTLRRIARAEAPDHGFARYLYRQDVRELRLAALHIACPACFTPEEFPAWAAGIVNSEIAEEAAFALLSRAEAFPALFSAWIASPDALLQYAALLAAARSPALRPHGLLRPSKPCTAMQRLRRRSKRRRSDDRGDRRRNFRRCGYLCCTGCLCL